MEILITGGTGFVSSHLVAALLKAGHRVTSFSRSGEFAFSLGEDAPLKNLRIVRGDISNRLLLADLMKDVDVLIHNASAVGAQGILRSSDEYIDTNIGGTTGLSEILANSPHKIKHVILGSSISVYGEGSYICEKCGLVRPAVRRRNSWNSDAGWNPSCPNCHGIIAPTNTREDAARNGEHLYATTKKCQEDLLSLAANSAEIPLTIFRYATIYGPGQRQRNPYMQMLAKIADGKSPEISEDGMQTRDFVYVSDVVAANLLALESTSASVRVFNIGSDRPTCLKDFVCSFSSAWARLNASDVVEPIVMQTLSPGDIRHCNVDSTLAADTLGYSAKVSMQEGIGRLLSWYSSQIDSGSEAITSMLKTHR